MTDETINTPLLELTDPALARTLSLALATARTDFLAAARDLAAIPEAGLKLPWTWIVGGEVHYGAYRA